MLQGDFNQAAYWYKLCTAYNPHYHECSVNLIVLYLSFELPGEALGQLERTLQLPPQEREMLNTLLLSDCTLPRTALFALPRAARAGALQETEGVALFALLLLRGMQHHRCPLSHISKEDEVWLGSLLKRHGRDSKFPLPPLFITAPR